MLTPPSAMSLAVTGDRQEPYGAMARPGAGIAGLTTTVAYFTLTVTAGDVPAAQTSLPRNRARST